MARELGREGSPAGGPGGDAGAVDRRLSKPRAFVGAGEGVRLELGQNETPQLGLVLLDELAHAGRLAALAGKEQRCVVGR